MWAELGRVRWKIFAFMFTMAMVAYVQQKTLTVTAVTMMPELGLSQVDVGWMESAFVVGYALFQMPGALVGQRYGARLSLAVMGLVAWAALISIPAATHLFHGHTLFWVFVSAQALLGVAQAGVFPVSAGVLERWFPARLWARIQGLQAMGFGLGAAITPPVITSLMVNGGWRLAVLLSSLPALALALAWGWYGRDLPSEHRRVCPEELRELNKEGSPQSALAVGSLPRLLLRPGVLLLSISYFCMNCAFYLLSNWCFLYLVQNWHLPILESGWLAMVPPLAAAMSAAVGGFATDLLCIRYGPAWGLRVVPLIALPAAGALLGAVSAVTSAYGAVATLAATFAFIELTEGAFWAAAMTIGGAKTMAVGGLLNTGGNLGGIVAIPVVAYLTAHGDWQTAFLGACCCTLASAAAWLGIRATRD
jgi:ACS family glucarate transporter-like MFS transporter